MWGIKDIYDILTIIPKNLIKYGKKILVLRKKRNYLKNVWNPFLQKLNKKLESIYSKDILAPLPEIIVEDKIEKAIMHKKRITLPLNSYDVKNQSISSNTFEQAFQAIHRSRTQKFRNHLPEEIKKPLDYVIEARVGWDLRQESKEISFDEEELPYSPEYEDQTVMVEDIFYAQELVPTLHDIVEDFAEKPPDSRIHDQTRNIFLQKYQYIQSQNRGILCIINPRRVSFLNKGLRAIIAPVKRDFPQKCNDWHIFFWKKKEIIAKAEIRGFVSGSFDQLWSKYNRNLLRINGKSVQESRNIHEAWAKGVGAKSHPRSRMKGPPKEMTLVKLIDFRDLKNPISEGLVLETIGRPLDQFALITQKQVRSLIGLC